MNIQFTQTRLSSLVTGENSLDFLYSLKNFPVFIGCTESPAEQDKRADMNWDICTKTGFIQLKDLLPLDVIYSAYHSEAVGGVWAEHHESLAQFCAEFGLQNVLEIGGSNAVIAEKYVRLEPEAHWTIVEPNPNFETKGNIKLIKGFFDENFVFEGEPDGVIHSHVLEHLYEPFEALNDIFNLLKPGQKHIFSIPQLHKWLQNKFPNTLNFEHTVFLTEELLDEALPAFGFKILEKKHFKEHSVFYATERLEQKAPYKVTNRYEEYKKLFLEFIEYHDEMVADLNEKIDNFDGPVYLFGAHIFSQFLLEFGLKTDRIVSILDDSELKQGKRLYGSNLFVEKPTVAKDKGAVLAIVKAGSYTEEISNRLREMNPKITIIN